MKRILLCILLMCGPLAAAQNAQVSGYCLQGGIAATTSGLPSTNFLQGIIPSCTVTVYLTGTTNLATIFDVNGNPLANPFTASPVGSIPAGFWIFTAANNQGLDVIGSGGIPPNTYSSSTVLLRNAFPGGGAGGPFCPLVGCTYSGTITAPALGNVIFVDGYTSGTSQGAWSSGTTYAPCSIVTSGGNTYASTQTTQGIIPGTGDSAHGGTNAYDWLLVRSDGVTYTPSAAECADIIAIGNGERATIGTNNVGKSYSLNFGSGTYGIVNSLFVGDPAPMFNGVSTPNRVSITFIGQGSHSTHIVQTGTLPSYTTADGTMNTPPTSTPTATVFEPTVPNASHAITTWALQGIDVSGNNIAPYAIDMRGFNANAAIRDVQYESGTVGQARFGFNGSNDSWTSSPNVQGMTDYTQGQGGTGAFLTASLSAGVPTVGFGVQLTNITKGSGYPLSGTGTCAVNGGTSTATATCTVAADGFGGAAITLTSPGTYSTTPTSVSVSFGGGTGTGATPSISAGSGYGPNTQIVLLGTKGKTSIYPCTVMPAVSSFTPAHSSVPVFLYPQGSVTPTISSGAITLGPWATATGASGCVAPVEVWASDLGSTPVAIGTDFSNVTDAGQLGGLFGTSGAVCTFNFTHGNNKIVGLHFQGQGRYGICNGSSNIYDHINEGEQYEGGIYSTVPYQYDHVEVSYSVPFTYHAVSTQTSFAAANSSSSGGAIRDLICGSNPFVRGTLEYNNIVNYRNGGVALSSFVNGSGYTVPPSCSVNGGTPLLNAGAACSVALDGNGGIIPHVDNGGAYAPGSATPTIVYTGGNGSGASAVISLVSAVPSVWNSPANTGTTDVDNMDYCGPLTAGSRFNSKSASMAVNGISSTMNQTNSASAQGFSGPLGVAQVLTDDVIDPANGYGANAITYTVTGNTATNSLVHRGNQWTWINNLTGGGHVQHIWSVLEGMGTNAGTVTDDAADFLVTDNGLANAGTITARAAYKCQSPLNGTTAFCVDDQSATGIRTTGVLKSGSTYQFSVDTSGNVTAPNIAAGAIKVGIYGAVSASGTGEAYPPLPQAITVLSATAFALTPPTGCSTFPVVTLWDVTQSLALASVTLASGTFQYTMTINHAAAAAGDVIAFRTNTAPVGCSPNAAQVTVNAWYN